MTRRKGAVGRLMLAAALMLLMTRAGATMSDLPGGKNGFDWLFGRWTVHNRFLVERLQGSSSWRTFDAEYEAWPILHGWANQDRFVTEFSNEPFEGMSLRYFNPETSEWSIHWLDTRVLKAGRPGIDEVVRGRMDGGKGEFFGTTEYQGRKIDVRFRWRYEGGGQAHWEQAYSADGGKTWETNWIMKFTRIAEPEQ